MQIGFPTRHGRPRTPGRRGAGGRAPPPVFFSRRESARRAPSIGPCVVRAHKCTDAAVHARARTGGAPSCTLRYVYDYVYDPTMKRTQSQLDYLWAEGN